MVVRSLYAGTVPVSSSPWAVAVVAYGEDAATWTVTAWPPVLVTVKPVTATFASVMYFVSTTVMAELLVLNVELQ